MLRVGLTGGLGSGKSTVAALFRALGAHVIEADAIGRMMMQPGQPVYQQIVAHFGSQVVGANGQLDRSALARLAFEDGRLEELNAIVHPAVIAAQAQWMEQIEANEPNAVAMVESALIFETKHASAAGWHKRFDKIILVTTPRELAIARFVERSRDGRNISAEKKAFLEADAHRRLAAQMPDSEKAAMCDYIIENKGSIADLEPTVRQIYEALKEAAKQPVERCG
ncbi:MAG: dephospho-CoA kinase [Acidobacteriaceae bacterium]